MAATSAELETLLDLKELMQLMRAQMKRLEFLAGLQILASGVQFVAGSTLVPLEDPASAAATGVPLYHNGRSEWAAVTITAVGYLNTPVRVARNADACRQTQSALALVPDNVAKVFFLGPNEGLYGLGTEPNGPSYALVVATPLSKFDSIHG